jgi:hypothetical protein
VDLVADDAPSPLDVLLQTMRLHLQAGELDAAVAAAKAAAPYVHARAVAGRKLPALSVLGDDELDELCGPGFDGEKTSPGDPV